jgi:acyl dehydratase
MSLPQSGKDAAMAQALESPQQRIASVEAIRQMVGTELGVSDWFEIDQSRITQFAEATADMNTVHLDPEVGKAWGLGGTIAHGFLTLSLILKLQEGIVPVVENLTHGYNYGLERVRFLSPVPCGKRVRGRFALADFRPKEPGGWRSTIDVTIEIEGETKPALTCQWLSIIYATEA